MIREYDPDHYFALICLPPPEQVAAAKAILERIPAEWHTVTAHAAPKGHVLVRGDEEPYGYAGMLFTHYTGDQPGARFAAWLTDHPAAVLRTEGLLEAYLRHVRWALR